MIKQLLNSAIAKYRDLSVARRSIIWLCLRHRQIIDLLATDKSRYFAQSRPIIVYYTSLLLYRVYKKRVIELCSALARSLYNLQKSLFHSRKDQAFSFRMSPFL